MGSGMEGELISILQRLAGSLDDGEEGQLAVVNADQLEVARACVPVLGGREDVAEFWREAAESGISFAGLAKALGAMMRDNNAGRACLSCVFYSTLLRMEGCPVRKGRHTVLLPFLA